MSKKLTKKEKMTNLFEQLYSLELDHALNGKGWFIYSRGGGIHQAICVLGYEDQYLEFRKKKVQYLINK
jgi:hypothetical protein